MERWTPRMLPTVPEALWRKSSQWVALTRAHAMRAVEDAAINRAIRKHCTYGYDAYLRRCGAGRRLAGLCCVSRLCAPLWRCCDG